MIWRNKPMRIKFSQLPSAYRDRVNFLHVCLYLCACLCVWSVNPTPQSCAIIKPRLCWLDESDQAGVTWVSSLVQSKNGVWCKSRVYCCHLSHYLVKTTLRILGQQIREKKIWVLIMWMVFLANLRRAVPCSQMWNELLAASDPVGTTIALLGLLRPLHLRHPSLEFTALIIQCTRAILCLPAAMARGRTHTRQTAARLTRAACSATAAVTLGLNP